MTEQNLRDTLERSISQELSGVFWGILGGIPEWRQRTLTQDLASIIVRDTRDLMNEIRAEAWDEGYWNGLADGQTGYNVPDNPYYPNEK